MAKLPTQCFLAPMAGITDRAYRVWMRQLGAETVVTELVSAEAFVHGSRRTKEMVDLVEEELPCGVQIFGANPEHLCELSKYAESKGATFIDLNFGCPVQKVTKSGAGAAMLKNLPLMKQIFECLKTNLNIPVSLKIRTGWDANNINVFEICQLAQDSSMDWVFIHGRTRDQKYEGHSNWNLIKECHERFDIPVIGNGDIKSAAEAKEKIDQNYASATMIARAVLVNPLIFKQWHQPNFDKPILELIHALLPCIEKYTHPKVSCVRYKKVIAWLSTGFEQHAEFRTSLMREDHDLNKITRLSENFFSKTDVPNCPKELSFLKGGHG